MSIIRTSFLRSSFLRTSTAALILSAPLMVGACSQKDKGPSAEKSSPSVGLSLKSPSRTAFAKHFEVPKRKVSEAEAQKALGGLNLLDSSEDNLSWAKSSGKAGNYTYSDLNAKGDEGTITIDRAELIGVHMDGETATFDRADFSGIKIYNEKDDMTVTFADMSMARPSPAMAKSIIRSLSKIDGIDDLEIDGEDRGFGALSISDMAVKSTELNGNIDTMIWGEDEQTGLSDILIDDVDMNFDSQQGQSGQFKLGEFSATGLRTGLLEGMGGPTAMVGKFGSMGKNFDEVRLDNLVFDSSVVSINTEGFAGKATEKGGVTTIKQVSEPFIITLKESPKSPQAAQAYAMAKELGFDELVFQSSQTQIIDSNTDTVTVKDGLVTMKDGFNLDYNYSASGVKELRTRLKSTNGARDLDAAMAAMTLNGLQLRLEDKSIVDRGLKLAAQFQGTSQETIKQQIKIASAGASLFAGAGIEAALMGEMGTALSEFLEKGGTLSVVVDPPAPVAMSELANLKRSDLNIKDLGFAAKVE